MKDLNAQRKTFRPAPRGSFFLLLGLLMLLGNLFAQAPALAGVSFALLVAGILGWRGYQKRGHIPGYVIWWVFGMSFAFFFSLGQVLGLNTEQISQWIPVLSFLMLGGMMYLRRRT